MNFTVGLPLQTILPELRAGRTERVAEVFARIEEMGFWGIAVPDHLLSIGTSGTGHGDDHALALRYPDPFTMLAYAAAMTLRVRLVTRTAVLPYRSPFATAHALATVDSVSGGRLVAGVGIGYDDTEFRLLGIDRRLRGRLSDEYLEIIRLLWSSDAPVDFAGRFHSFQGAQMLVRPVQKGGPPIWVGGNSRHGLARALRFGHAWQPDGFAYPESPGHFESLDTHRLRQEIEWAAEQASAAGRAALEVVVSSGPPLRFSDAPQHAGRRAREIRHFTGCGTPEELAEEFGAYRDAGAQAFVVLLPSSTLEEYLDAAEKLATTVAPALN